MFSMMNKSKNRKRCFRDLDDEQFLIYWIVVVHKPIAFIELITMMKFLELFKNRKASKIKYNQLGTKYLERSKDAFKKN